MKTIKHTLTTGEFSEDVLSAPERAAKMENKGRSPLAEVCVINCLYTLSVHEVIDCKDFLKKWGQLGGW